MKDDRLNLYKSLFKGREDVFAFRWEKGGKSSYMPAYSFDPYRYRQHQMKGGLILTKQTGLMNVGHLLIFARSMIYQLTWSVLVPVKVATYGYFLKNPMKRCEAERS
jgi:hypothetical protein